MKQIVQLKIDLSDEANQNKDLIYNYSAVSRIGIWGPAGTKLKINKGNFELNNQGIYELDLEDTGAVLGKIFLNQNPTEGILYIDMICEGSEN